MAKFNAIQWINYKWCYFTLHRFCIFWNAWVLSYPSHLSVLVSDVMFSRIRVVEVVTLVHTHMILAPWFLHLSHLEYALKKAEPPHCAVQGCFLLMEMGIFLSWMIKPWSSLVSLASFMMPVRLLLVHLVFSLLSLIRFQRASRYSKIWLIHLV